MTIGEKRILDYIRWGLTKEQAEAWVIRKIYPMRKDGPDYDLMKSVRINRCNEKDAKQVDPGLLQELSFSQEIHRRPLWFLILLKPKLLFQKF